MELKIKKLKEEFKIYQDIASKYIAILKLVEKRTTKKGIIDIPDFMTGEGMKLTEDEFYFIESNSFILQEKCNIFGLGRGLYRRPFGLGIFPDFEFIANFPTLYRNGTTRDEAMQIISIIRSALYTFTQKIQDLLEDDVKIQQFIGDSKNQVNNTQLRKVYHELIDILSRFHRFIIQIGRSPHGKSTIPSISISNEYDIQHILHAILKLRYNDIRPEEYTPSYAGSSTRMDFLLKDEQIVIEVKKTSETLKDSEIGKQLIEDIAKYRTHPDCKVLICFVYDPDGIITNPDGLEKDLSKEEEDFQVIVIINPKN